MTCENKRLPGRSRQGVLGRQAGLTLFELMVALGLGLALLAGTGAIYVSSRQSYLMQEGSGRVQEAGRYALEMIGRGLRQAGTTAPWTSTDMTMPLDCKNSAICTPASPVTLANGLRGMQVQFYANNDEVNPADGVTLGARDCADGFAPMGTLVTNIYSLGGQGNTSLVCSGSASGNIPVLLLSGVEDFQVVYGVDLPDAGGSYDQSANQYIASPPAGAQVVSARICLVVRAPTPGLGVVNGQRQEYLNCNGALGVATCMGAASACGGAANAALSIAPDTYLRRTFVATFTLRNVVSTPPI